jgi:hypothetical protein
VINIPTIEHTRPIVILEAAVRFFIFRTSGTRK